MVRRAEQIEIVDITPEALQRRMAHGNIYPPERVDAALTNYFRVGNLSALRELALLWVADRVDEGLQRYRAAHGIDQPWEARERIVVALPGGPEGETLLRRAVRITARTNGSDLLAVHVVRSDGLARVDPGEIGRQRRLTESMGGTWHQVVGDDVAVALLDFARAENATQVVVGASSRGRWESFLAGEGIGARVTRLSGHIDVHLVTHEAASAPGLLPALPVAGLTTSLSLRRRLQGAALAAVLLPLLTLVLSRLRGDLNLPSDILLYLAVVILVALTGGHVAGAGRRGRGQPAAQLLLHPAALHVHHRGQEQRAGAPGVHRGRRTGVGPRRTRRPAYDGGRTGLGGGGDPGRARRRDPAW